MDNDEWVYGSLIISTRRNFKRCYITYKTWDEGYITYEVVPDTVGQFTGLTDKNGKKIFEGDIISYTWDTLCGKEQVKCVISYNDSEIRFVGKPISNNPGLLIFKYIGERGEVIGNIHDNSELLEEQNV